MPRLLTNVSCVRIDGLIGAETVIPCDAVVIGYPNPVEREWRVIAGFRESQNAPVFTILPRNGELGPFELTTQPHIKHATLVVIPCGPRIMVVHTDHNVGLDDIEVPDDELASTMAAKITKHRRLLPS